MKLLGCLVTVVLFNSSLLLELKITSTPDGESHPAPCAITCAGVSRYTDTAGYNWRSYSGSRGGSGRAWKQLNIKECGFVTRPVIIATISGFYQGDCPSIFVENGYNSVQTVEKATPTQMVDNLCDVHWSAFGYNC